MGVDISTLRAINFATRTRKIDFDRCVMLGRQEIFFTKEDFEFVKKRASLPIDYDDTIRIGSFAEPLFKKYGALQVDSIDASPYEGASLIMDFNRPIPPALHNQFTVFADFGSIEHIFDISQAIENIFALLSENGTVIIKTQANGYAGHGFYQISPEFFYSVFSEENGFADTLVSLVDLQSIRRWCLVPDPKQIRKRNVIPEHRTYYIFCFSTKKGRRSEISVLQSDYELGAWQTMGHSHMGEYRRSLFSRIRHRVNPFVFQNLRGRYYALKSQRQFDQDTRRFDPDVIPTTDFAKLRCPGAGQHQCR